MSIKNIVNSHIKSFLPRASVLLFAVTMAAGCREVPGSCSRATDNLCLAFQLSDPEVVPSTLRLTFSSTGHAALTQDFNADPILAQRAYILEVSVADPSIQQLNIDCDGLLPAGAVVVRGSKTVNPATAERPTVIILSPDMYDSDMGAPADLLKQDMMGGDMRSIPPSDGPGTSDGLMGADL